MNGGNDSYDKSRVDSPHLHTFNDHHHTSHIQVGDGHPTVSYSSHTALKTDGLISTHASPLDLTHTGQSSCGERFSHHHVIMIEVESLKESNQQHLT